MVSETKLGCCKYCGSTNHRGWQCRLNPKVQARLNKPKVVKPKPHKLSKPVKHRKKSGRSSLIRKFDSVFSQYIRRKAEVNGTLYCYTCGKKLTYDTAVAMHYINRRAVSVRFNEDNVKVGCRECNAINKDQPEVLKKYAELLGEDKVAELNRLKATKISTKDLEELYSTYRTKLSSLQR